MARRRTRVAPAAQAILDQATFHRPKRSRRSDGTVGDRAHRARRSDHNPDERGIVMAADLTHDPRNGIDAHGWARWLARKRDPRVKLLISNGESWTPERGWRPYTGPNPHRTHAHVSIVRGREFDTGPWFAGWLHDSPPPPPPTPTLPQRATIRSGERGRLVEIAQWELAMTTGRHFPPESIGTFDLFLIAAVRDLGRVLGKPWDGMEMGAEQWAALDFLYLAKGHQPVTS